MKGIIIFLKKKKQKKHTVIPNNIKISQKVKNKS